MESTFSNPPVKSSTSAHGISLKFVIGGFVLLGVIGFVFLIREA